ncbi:MAG: T9SS type B sorting domain-containing protein [Flavobacteriales bacterium]|nr:T9SS type B sorting domain-containing protein [Flavobacteriales bacterium]
MESQQDIPAMLQDTVICEDTNGFLLCPLPDNLITPDLTFDWNIESDSACYTALWTGYFEVNISNECDNVTVGASIDFASGYVGPGPYNIVECDDDFYELSAGNVFAGYTWYWGEDPNNNQMDQNFTVDQEGTYTVYLNVTDNLDCNTYTTEYTVTIADYPSLNPNPPADTLYLCPNEIEVLDLGYAEGTFYSWEVDCPNDPLYFETESDNLDLGSDMFPPDCLNQFLLLTATADNVCPGSETAEWIVQASLCPITPPNVFSPNEDNLGNDRFILDGIEVFDRTELYVYDRWGKLIFESQNYDNTWRATDVPDGVYYYIARMLDSTDEPIREVESHLHILR